MPENMIKVKKESYGNHPMSCCSDGEHYPYGTSLRLDADMIESLGIGELAVEDIVEIRAVGFVNSKHESTEAKGEGSKSIEIQITALKIKRKSDEDSTVKQLYGG